MRNFQHKRGWKNILESWPVLGLLGVLLFFFAWGVVSFFNKMEITSENAKIAQDKMTELQQQKEKLSTDISNLKTQSGVEASIREKFGLAKDGEGEIVVVDDQTPATTSQSTSGGFWNFIKNLFH